MFLSIFSRLRFLVFTLSIVLHAQKAPKASSNLPPHSQPTIFFSISIDEFDGGFLFGNFLIIWYILSCWGLKNCSLHNYTSLSVGRLLSIFFHISVYRFLNSSSSIMIVLSIYTFKGLILLQDWFIWFGGFNRKHVVFFFFLLTLLFVLCFWC